MCDTPTPPYLPNGRAAPPVASRHMRFLNRMRREIDDYDGYCKRQLSRKAVLARLLKDCLPECAPFSIDEIERCCLSSLLHDTASSLSHSNDSMEELVSGLATDASDLGAGTSKLDLLFLIQPPSTEDSAAVMVNIEPQVKKGLSQGRASSLLDSISSLMRTLGLSREQAMDALEVPKEERPRYNSLLDDKNK